MAVRRKARPADRSVSLSPAALCLSEASDLPLSPSLKSRSSSFSRKYVDKSGFPTDLSTLLHSQICAASLPRIDRFALLDSQNCAASLPSSAFNLLSGKAKSASLYILYFFLYLR
jgi:hypothetical protein